jgi:hypothetical protein
MFLFGGDSALFQYYRFCPHRRFELLVTLVCLWLLTCSAGRCLSMQLTLGAPHALAMQLAAHSR